MIKCNKPREVSVIGRKCLFVKGKQHTNKYWLMHLEESAADIFEPPKEPYQVLQQHQ